MESSEPTDEELARTLEIAEQIVNDRGLLIRFSKEDRQRLMQAVERVASPDRQTRTRLVRAF